MATDRHPASAIQQRASNNNETQLEEITTTKPFAKYVLLSSSHLHEAALEAKPYTYILDEKYRWESWVAPKGEDGELDHNKALTGDYLVEFVDRDMIPYLHGFKQRATSPNTIG